MEYDEIREHHLENLHRLFVDGLYGHNAAHDWVQVLHSTQSIKLSDNVVKDFMDIPNATTRLNLAIALVDSLRRDINWLDICKDEMFNSLDYFLFLLKGLPISQHWRIIEWYHTLKRPIPIFYHTMEDDGSLYPRDNMYNIYNMLYLQTVTVEKQPIFVMSLGTANAYQNSDLLNKLWFNTQKHNNNNNKYFDSYHTGTHLFRLSIELLTAEQSDLNFHILTVHGNDHDYDIASKERKSLNGNKNGGTHHQLQRFILDIEPHTFAYIIHIAIEDLLDNGEFVVSDASISLLLKRMPDKCFVLFRDISTINDAKKARAFQDIYPNICYSVGIPPIDDNSPNVNNTLKSLRESIDGCCDVFLIKSKRLRMALSDITDQMLNSIPSEEFKDEVKKLSASFTTKLLRQFPNPSKENCVSKLFSLAVDVGRSRRYADYRCHPVMNAFITTIQQNSDFALWQFSMLLKSWTGVHRKKLMKDRMDCLTKRKSNYKKVLDRISKQWDRVNITLDMFWKELFILFSKAARSHRLFKHWDFESAYAAHFFAGWTVSAVSHLAGDYMFEKESLLSIFSGHRQQNLLCISVLGVCGVGKSSLMNSMFGCRFDVDHLKCTMGVDLAYSKTMAHGMSDFIIQDTEGLLQIEQTNNHIDEHIMVYTFSTSHLIVIMLPSDMDAILRSIRIGLKEYLVLRRRLDSPISPILIFQCDDEEINEEIIHSSVEEACEAAQVPDDERPITYVVVGNNITELREVLLDLSREIINNGDLTTSIDWVDIAADAWKLVSLEFQQNLRVMEDMAISWEITEHDRLVWSQKYYRDRVNKQIDQDKIEIEELNQVEDKPKVNDIQPPLENMVPKKVPPTERKKQIPVPKNKTIEPPRDTCNENCILS